MIKAISHNALSLAVVAAVCVAILSIVNLLTAPKIAEQALASKLAVLQEVLPGISVDHVLLSDCRQVVSLEFLGRETAQNIYRWRQQDKVAAFLVESTAPDGYSGNIDLIVAVTPEGLVLGSRVVNHQETPGLGDKVESRRSNWIFSLSDKTVTAENAAFWAVRKDGGQFDQFTGATITPRAVVTAVRKAALYVLQHPELASLPANCEVAE
ncbi:electron transport complex subunit RsxG [Rheinheimera sp. MMS21-TC3]|uniref:electron transport complex subunit RsxG n=1 Tax=Rheinheimera sp. MMS21-TC3 TaxID=3072790 RepID=UPI0028C47A39|nr:electron transport complex subunit RsxG [Rheinheimera sp. MMS21-TC3]WNO61219.1 electron transport complex subunit RsxG [Rheinheimera sp. MMS21-TC3]